VIGSAIALVAGSLWAAAAFSYHNSAFYNHVAWWFGATMIGVALVGALIAGGLSYPGRHRRNRERPQQLGPHRLAPAAVVSVTAIAHGTTSTLSLHNGAIKVDLATHVAFWSAMAGMGAAAIGGLAGEASHIWRGAHNGSLVRRRREPMMSGLGEAHHLHAPGRPPLGTRPHRVVLQVHVVLEENSVTAP
jgi:hypothetical protein